MRAGVLWPSLGKVNILTCMQSGYYKRPACLLHAIYISYTFCSTYDGCMVENLHFIKNIALLHFYYANEVPPPTLSL